jgi:hypothetical protein
MKKYLPILVVVVLVVSIIGIAGGNSVWASPKSSAGSNSPLRTLITVTSDGTYNVGGVCEITVAFNAVGNQIKADAEVPVMQSVVVPFSGEGNLLFPGCHFAFSKGSMTDISSLKVCFGASRELQMGVYYYLDKPGVEGRVWNLLPANLEDNGRLVCAPVLYEGVYMPAGKVVPPPDAGTTAINPFFPSGTNGTVQTPPNEVTITKSGTYAVGGVCLLTTKYNATGLADTVQVEYPTKHYTANTQSVPFSDYANGNLIHFPGCHVVHYRNQQIQDQMNKATPKDGTWQICFAAIPDKTMTIYYYSDNLTNTTAPWVKLVTTTANGMACADLVDFSAVYAPAAK